MEISLSLQLTGEYSAELIRYQIWCGSDWIPVIEHLHYHTSINCKWWAHNQSQSRVVRLQSGEEAEKKRDNKDLTNNIINRCYTCISFWVVTLWCLVKERKILSLIWSEGNVNEDAKQRVPSQVTIYSLIIAFEK